MTTDAVTTREPDHTVQTIPGLGQLPNLVAGEWNPTRTGDYHTDCEAGRRAAETLLAVIDKSDNPLFFGTVMRAIVTAGKFDGVEAGFCSVISLRL